MHRLEDARDALRVELAGQHRLVPRRGHERHRREIVELVRLDLMKQTDERQLVEQIGGFNVTRSRRCSIRQRFAALVRRTTPTTSCPFSSRSSAR